jgi:hypothetical protein
MIGAAVLIALGIIAGQFFPTSFREWVRAVAGKARDAAFGSRPARAANVLSSKEDRSPARAESVPDTGRDEVRPSPPNKPIEAVKGFLAGVGNAATFVVKHPVLFIGLALVAFWLIAGSSCARLPFGKSADALRMERELAEANAAVKEHEARLAELSRDLAVNTERDRARRAEALAEAEQDISNAESQVDPDALFDAYERGYLCLLDPRACPGSDDPATGGSAPVRGPSASPV